MDGSNAAALRPGLRYVGPPGLMEADIGHMWFSVLGWNDQFGTTSGAKRRKNGATRVSAWSATPPAMEARRAGTLIVQEVTLLSETQ